MSTTDASTDAAIPPSKPAPSFALRAYSGWARLGFVLLEGLGLANLGRLLWAWLGTVLTGGLGAPLGVLLRELALYALLPVVLARLGRWMSAARLELLPGELVLRRGQRRIEMPLSALLAPRAYRLPWPSAGLVLRLASGRSLGAQLELADPEPVLLALCGHGMDAQAAREHPAMRYADARRKHGPGRLGLALKFGVFPLLPALVQFQLHQRIAFGGPLGEYHLAGLGAYLRTFGFYELLTLSLLVLYAGGLRVLGEALVFGLSYGLRARAVGLRRGLEGFLRLAFYLGVPVLLGWRLLQ